MSSLGLGRPLPAVTAVGESGVLCQSPAVRKTGILSRHRRVGPVQATTLKGRWHHLEHEWWAEQGSYSFEPPGDIHTLEVPNGVEEMITLFHVTGAYPTSMSTPTVIQSVPRTCSPSSKPHASTTRRPGSAPTTSSASSADLPAASEKSVE